MLTEYELEKMEHYIDQEGRLSNMATSRLIEEVRTLQQQNKQLIEALSYYAEFGVNPSHGDWDVGEHAREVLKSIVGETP